MRQRAPKTSPLGSSGQSRVQSEFEEIGWGVAPNPQEHDVGTDLWLFARDARGFDLGAVLGAQVKTGPAYFTGKELDENGEILGWWFRDNDGHFNYWCDHAVPHIVVLHNPQSKISYWVLVTRESAISTGKRNKILVSASSRVDTEHSDELIEAAVRFRAPPTWEGSVWETNPKIPDDARLRYALMTPRLIAPHPNRRLTDLDAYQAIALLVQLRIDDLEQMQDEINILDPSLLSRAPEWEWRFFAALHCWLTEQQIDRILQCIVSATAVEQRVAAIACAALAYYERGKIVEAVQLLEPELTKDNADPVDHGWLLAHLAHCRLELGGLDEASKLALTVYRLRNEGISDPTARALAASASYILFSANDRDAKNLENVVQGNDTASSWWRSLSLGVGLDRQFDETFEQWTGKMPRIHYTRDVAWEQFRSGMLLSGISADRASWGYAASLLACRVLMKEGIDESLVWALQLLRLSGNERALQQAIPRMRRLGPVFPIVSVGKMLDLNRSTRTSLRSDISFIQLSADVLDRADCDRHARWGLATLKEVDKLERRLSTQFMVEDAILDMLYELVLPSSQIVRRAIVCYLVALPVASQLASKNLGRILLRIPETEWTDADIDALRSRDDADHSEFQDALEKLLAKRDPDIRAGLVDRVRSGDLNALGNYGSVTDLPADAVAGMVDCLTKGLSQNNLSFLGLWFSRLDGVIPLTVKLVFDNI